jgi:hypothetical protein
MGNSVGAGKEAHRLLLIGDSHGSGDQQKYPFQDATNSWH